MTAERSDEAEKEEGKREDANRDQEAPGDTSRSPPPAGSARFPGNEKTLPKKNRKDLYLVRNLFLF